MIFRTSAASLVAQSVDDEKLKIDQVRWWLSEPGNNWRLLIFDNYDTSHNTGRTLQYPISDSLEATPFWPHFVE
jgi:hypothetical protein